MRILNTQNLKAYIKTRGVAFQPINCLFEVDDKITACAKNHISAQIVDDNWKVLTKKEAFEKGFEELANWVTKSDTIVAIELKEPIFNEYYISVCFPENDFVLA